MPFYASDGGGDAADGNAHIADIDAYPPTSCRCIYI